jgi:hypothetical protein
VDIVHPQGSVLTFQTNAALCYCPTNSVCSKEDGLRFRQELWLKQVLHIISQDNGGTGILMPSVSSVSPTTAWVIDIMGYGQRGRSD